MRYAVIIIALFILGCGARKREPLIIYKDKIVTDTVIKEVILKKDTFIFVKLPVYDTAYIEKIIEVPKYIKINVPVIKKENGLVGIEAWIKNNILGAKGYLTDSTILVKLDSLITYKEINKQYIQEIEKNNTERIKYVPKFYKYCTNILIIVVIVLVVLYYIRRRFFK